MQKVIIVLALAFCIVSCVSHKKNSYDETEISNYSDSTQNSRVLKFKYIAIMDTITAIVEGKVSGLDSDEAATVQLINSFNTYTQTSDTQGQFKFYHIAAGTYLLKATSNSYKPLTKEGLHLGTGDIAELHIAMKSIE
ncbi:MAG TPA: carboxypeptidase-like regulatory domain-containing protein [Ohtaekwangia sp.]|uniref:carboxypeptidase-like regulatory domain-containing protein n=1 Tax=Ohtaekwangia sp. TaxID=2066019 RepID=UPI002F93B41B